MAVYFTTCEKIKESTPINFNVEDQVLTMNIKDSQEIYIQPILGTVLYNKLKSDIINNQLTGAYKTLMDDYIIPTLIQYSLANSLIFIRFKLMNKSISSQNSDNSVPADLDEVKFLLDEIRNRAQFYAKRLSEYLLENLSTFPEYMDNTKIDEMKPTTNNYFCGMYLGDDVNVCDRFKGKNDGIFKTW